MKDKQIEVGKSYPWALVPDGALVRTCSGWYVVRESWLHGHVVRDGVGWRDAGRIAWATQRDDAVTIIALGLTGEETADDLRALAERFEVREACSDNVRRVARK